MTYTISYIIGIVDYLIIFNVCEAFMIPKVSQKFQYSIIVVSAVVTNTILTLLQSRVSVAEFVFVVLFNAVLMCFIYDGGVLPKVFSVIFAYFVMTLCENIPTIALIYLMDINFEDVLASVPLWLLFAATSRFLTYAITFLFQRWWKQSHSKIHTSKTEWIYMIGFSLISVITTIIVVLYYYNSGSTEILLLIYNICVFIANIFVFITSTKFADKRQVEQDNAMLKQQVKFSMENVESLLDNYSEQRKITHDFNNHLSTINSLLDNGNIEKAKEYVASISNKNFGKSILFSSNNPVVDVLLTQKYNIAKQNGISVQVKIDDLSALPMKDEDVVVVLSNMLDNAIDAAKECVDEKIIKIKFVKDNDGYILSVHNTANNNFVYNGQNVATTKEDKLSHGYGIKNIKTILDKYGYDYVVSGKDRRVSFTVLIG